MKTHLTILLTAFVLLWGQQFSFPRQAAAGLIAYDGFNYGPVGVGLNGLTGGGSFGWGGAWSTTGNSTIAAGSLTSPTVPMSVTGNSVTAAAAGTNRDSSRSFPSPLGTAGTSLYVGFLIEPEGVVGGGSDNGYFGLNLMSTEGGPGVVMIDKPGAGAENDWVLESNFGNGQFASSVPVISGQTYLMVCRIDFATSGSDTFSLFIDPPSTTQPATPDAVKGGVNFGQMSALDITGPGAFSIDELRVGTTFASVVPEPSAWLLAICGVGGLWFARRWGSKTALPDERPTDS